MLAKTSALILRRLPRSMGKLRQFTFKVPEHPEATMICEALLPCGSIVQRCLALPHSTGQGMKARQVGEPLQRPSDFDFSLPPRTCYKAEQHFPLGIYLRSCDICFVLAAGTKNEKKRGRDAAGRGDQNGGGGDDDDGGDDSASAGDDDSDVPELHLSHARVSSLQILTP